MRLYQTECPGWGFHGTIAREGQYDPAEAFDLAVRKIAAATQVDPFAVASWLDTSGGRHFADDVLVSSYAIAMLSGCNTPIDAALDAAVTRWMRWGITERVSAATGIPQGASYLTGVVANHGIRTNQ